MSELDILQGRQYENLKNVIIKETSEAKTSVAIYFTSNDLFYPHDAEHFRYSVIKKEYYEWKQSLVRRASKHIFVRDIYKQWYVSGINSKIADIDKLVSFLNEETLGYKEVICLGSSAGGYMASLIGSLIHADICFSFNGQWNINELIIKGDKIVSPLLYKAKETHDDCKLKYFDLREWVRTNPNIFYFRSLYSEGDIKQYNYIKDMINIHVISFKTSHHGIPFVKSSVNDIINMKYSDLLRFDNKYYIPIIFSIKVSGLFKTIKGVCKQLYKKLIRKLNDK